MRRHNCNDQIWNVSGCVVAWVCSQGTLLWDHCFSSLGCVCVHCHMGVLTRGHLGGISVSLHLYVGSGAAVLAWLMPFC